MHSISALYAYRFELFLTSQIAILFGDLVVPNLLFQNFIMPIFLILNLVTGLLLVSKKKRLSRYMLLLLIISTVVVVLNFIIDVDSFGYLKLACYFLFYGVVTIEIIKQVWNAKVVGKNVILGLISGYVALGLLAFFMCMTIEILVPHSFNGLIQNITNPNDISEQLMYYSYITLMTIGYGDITPITAVAQKASIFIGLIGQFYLVILTAVVVGKYINQGIKS